MKIGLCRIVQTTILFDIVYCKFVIAEVIEDEFYLRYTKQAKVKVRVYDSIHHS